MQTNHDPVDRTYERLTIVVAFLVAAAFGFGANGYGPQLMSSIRDFYHPPQHSRPQPSEIMMQHVKTTPFGPSPNLHEFFDSKANEYSSNKRLGDTYRMPPPRRP